MNRQASRCDAHGHIRHCSSFGQCCSAVNCPAIPRRCARIPMANWILITQTDLTLTARPQTMPGIFQKPVLVFYLYLHAIKPEVHPATFPPPLPLQHKHRQNCKRLILQFSDLKTAFVTRRLKRQWVDINTTAFAFGLHECPCSPQSPLIVRERPFHQS